MKQPASAQELEKLRNELGWPSLSVPPKAVFEQCLTV